MNHTVTILADENPLEFISRPTPQLRNTVEQQRAGLPAADFAEMMRAVRSIFNKFTERLLSFPAGTERGRAMHRMMEVEMKAVGQIPLTCGKGCSGCCSYEVEITEDEAAVLRDVVRSGQAVDRERLFVQAQRVRKDTAWRNFSNPDNRCGFLGADGACTVYEARPSICRKHVVTTPASACVTLDAPVAPVQILLAEILMSAAISIPGTEVGSLSKMLLKSLGELPTTWSHQVGAAAIVEMARAPQTARRLAQEVAAE